MCWPVLPPHARREVLQTCVLARTEATRIRFLRLLIVFVAGSRYNRRRICRTCRIGDDFLREIVEEPKVFYEADGR